MRSEYCAGSAYRSKKSQPSGATLRENSGLKLTPELIAAWYEEAKEADRFHRL
jgi:hypothetical protein